MLYAILVEGRGALGSVFSRDDFTDKEVQDTDGDGLPEFVDAWGQPLQFYRWPVLFHSDLQRGQNFLASVGQLFPATLLERDSRSASKTRSTSTSSSWRRAWWWSGKGNASTLGQQQLSPGIGERTMEWRRDRCLNPSSTCSMSR